MGATNMLRHPARLRALAIRGLALAGLLILATALVRAQDGQLRTGDPVNRPGTDQLIPRADTSTPPPATAEQLLPPVPASIEDPAPPGTNAEPVVPNARLIPVGPDGQALAIPGIQATEGVVVQIQPAGPAERTRPGLQNELVRLTIDPLQTWDEYANLGPETPAQRQAAPPNATPNQANKKPAVKAPIVEEVKTIIKDVENALTPAEKPAEPRHEAEAPQEKQPRTIEVVVTNRTRVFVHARSADGVDMFGAGTISSPATTPNGVDPTRRAADQPEPGRFATNFTNIKVGSYVAVRYRPVAGMNEAVNVNLIELPLIAPPEGAAAPVVRPRAVPVPTVRTIPGAVPPANEVPIREPVVPADPVIPAIPR